jgi:single-strand DNA-binding protein
VNVVVITGNLTRDPELRSTPGGTSVCKLRVAVNSRRKENDNWVDKPNFFDVTVWGGQGENCANYLSKGRPVAIEGRLDWREWEKDGVKRQSVEIIANSVQFLGSRDGSGGGGGGEGGGFSPSTDVPADASDFAGAAAGGGGDDDIPF